MVTMIQKYRKHLQQQKLFSKGLFVGYHLDVAGVRYWIGKDVEEAERNLEKAINTFANNGNNFNWYIERLDGFDYLGNPLWSNLDHTDCII